MTAIAVIGGGAVGSALAGAWVAAGHDVVIGSRRPDPAAHPRTASRAEAVAVASVVVNALPGEAAVAELGALGDALAGRTLLDLSNPAPGRGERTTSIAEGLQVALPGTSVVKALNTMLGPVMTAPGLLANPPTAFLAGDDDGAKAAVAALLTDLGWVPEQLADVGGLVAARVLEAFVDLVPALYARHRGAPFALGVSA